MAVVTGKGISSVRNTDLCLTREKMAEPFQLSRSLFAGKEATLCSAFEIY